jgi:hypothetical protein
MKKSQLYRICNPVPYVYREEDYLFSSALNYYNLPSIWDVNCIAPPVMTVGMPGFYKERFD